jgi:hypothetical protein
MNYFQCAKSHRIGTGLLLAVLALTVAGAARVPHPNVVLFDVRVGCFRLSQETTILHHKGRETAKSR